MKRKLAASRKNLQGSVPDQSEVALILVDLINPLDFPEAEQMVRFVPKMVRQIKALKKRAKAAGVPVIYVNDNFGRWRSDFRSLVETVRAEGCRGEQLARELAPEEDDYFVLKPKHSGFYASALETLLLYLGVERLVITGIAGTYCVLFTANDAYMRDYELAVPEDCTISNSVRENKEALALMGRYLRADTRPSNRVRFPRRKKRAEKPGA